MTHSHAQNGSRRHSHLRPEWCSRHQPHGRPECEAQRVSVLASWSSDDPGELSVIQAAPPRFHAVSPPRARAQERRGCGVVAVTVLREPASQLQSDFDYFERDNLTLTEYALMTDDTLFLCLDWQITV